MRTSGLVPTKGRRVGYDGGLSIPLSWDRTVEKFHWVTEALARDDRRRNFFQAVRQLDNISIAGPQTFLPKFGRQRPLQTPVLDGVTFRGRGTAILRNS